MNPLHGLHGSMVHHALIYDTDEQFLASTVPFCREGLARGEAVLAVTTPANISLLREALGADADRVEFARTSDWYRTPGRTLAAYHRYVEARSDRPGIRIIGEPEWLGRDTLENDEWTRYEAAVNKAFAGSRAWIVCPYDTRALPVSVIADARRTHPYLMYGGSVLPSPHYTPPDGPEGSWERHPVPPAPFPPPVHMDFGLDLSAVRAFTAAHAIKLGLPPESVDRLVFAVNEMASNALQHGEGTRSLTLWRDAHRVICDITDTGGATPAWYTGYLPPAPDQPSGHGMWTVRQLCDLVEVLPLAPGTLIRLHMDLDPTL